MTLMQSITLGDADPIPGALGLGRIAAASATPHNPPISIDTFLLATLFSMVVGFFFNFFPANQAASLGPLEALRDE